MDGVSEILHERRLKEIENVYALCERIGYGNVMDIASALWAIKAGAPQHLPSVTGFMTDEGKEVALQSLAARVEEIRSSLNYL